MALSLAERVERDVGHVRDDRVDAGRGEHLHLVGVVDGPDVDAQVVAAGVGHRGIRRREHRRRGRGAATGGRGLRATAAAVSRSDPCTRNPVGSSGAYARTASMVARSKDENTTSSSGAAHEVDRGARHRVLRIGVRLPPRALHLDVHQPSRARVERFGQCRQPRAARRGSRRTAGRPAGRPVRPRRRDGRPGRRRRCGARPARPRRHPTPAPARRRRRCSPGRGGWRPDGPVRAVATACGAGYEHPKDATCSTFDRECPGQDPCAVVHKAVTLPILAAGFRATETGHACERAHKTRICATHQKGETKWR